MIATRVWRECRRGKERDDGVVDADARSLAPWSVQAASSLVKKSRGSGERGDWSNGAQPAPGKNGYV